MGYVVIPNGERGKRDWDCLVNGKLKILVRTSKAGKEGNSFQHESFDKEGDYDVVVLVDITLNDIYLTVANKDSMPFKEANDIYTATAKKMTYRAKHDVYKWDLMLDDLRDRRIVELEDAMMLFEPVLGQP